jgi:hypothetical protein
MLFKEKFAAPVKGRKGRGLPHAKPRSREEDLFSTTEYTEHTEGGGGEYSVFSF